MLEASIWYRPGMLPNIQDMPPQPRTVPPTPDANSAKAEEPCNEGRKAKFCALRTSQHRRQRASPDVRTGHLKLGV